MYDLLCYLTRGLKEDKLPVVVRGDSTLIIDFMLGVSKPGKRALVELITLAKRKLRFDVHRKVYF